MATISSTVISDSHYKFPSLKGRENYHTWKIQMRDMFEEFDLWTIIDGTATRPSTGASTPGGTQMTVTQLATAQADWDKKNPHASTANGAWEALKRMYESIGTAAMTLLRNKFTSMRMNEGDDLEQHIQKARQVFDELNVALMAEGINRVNELEFIRQFLVSLPESWSVLVSVIDQTPETGDTDGVQLCQRILSRLLTEWHRRKAAGTTGQEIDSISGVTTVVLRVISLKNVESPEEAHTGAEIRTQVETSTTTIVEVLIKDETTISKIADMKIFATIMITTIISKISNHINRINKQI
ncbi:Copia-like polyprotein/retrotransposon, partial [Rhizoctonia solani AG-3 Rhs1AP]